ncbi:MAG: hypothetical protein WD602_02600 [Actinomycetota bacterium]
MNDPIEVADKGRIAAFSFEEMLKYHGPDYPGGVAHSFKVMQRAVPLLDPAGPAERRAIHIRTAFSGPGGRDGFELVTRAVSEGRFEVDPALERPERGRTLERYVFEFTYGPRKLTLTIREGFVVDEFIELARRQDRTEAEEAHLTLLKQQMTDRLLASPAPDVYEVLNPRRS